jgi:hypothetical protein
MDAGSPDAGDGSGGTPIPPPDPPPPQPGACNANESAFASARIWQLTDQQYVNVVRDVLGITLQGADAEITSPKLSDEFTNVSEGTTFSDATAQNYETAAEKVATLAIVPATMQALLGSTNPTTQQVQTFITSKVSRLWRRPVSSSETTTLTNLYNAGSPDGPSRSFELLIQAVLQWPSFLFRTELGASATPATSPFQLTPYELAAAASFLFAESTPDDSLWQKAQNGTLSSAPTFASEVDRLMAMPAAQLAMTRHVSRWMSIEALPRETKDAGLFPEYTPSLKASLYESGRAFARDIAVTGKLSDLFSSTKVYVNREISTVFGIPGGTTTTIVPVTTTLPERSAGLLTQPAFLAAANQRSQPADSVHRGLFVLQRLLCGADFGPIAAPPADEATQAAMMTGSERQLAEQRTASASCGGCHKGFDPYGELFLRFDAIGRYSADREVVLDTSTMRPTYQFVTRGAPIDNSATIPDALGTDLKGPLADVVALAKQLATAGPDKRVAFCSASWLARYIMGHDPGVENSCALATVKDRFYQSGSFAQFYRDFVTSPGYSTRDPGL